jgi:hypothetical protein
VAAIRATEASTIVGLGIKLAALHTPPRFRDDIEDHVDTIEAHRATLDDIARLTARTDFVVPSLPAIWDEA